MKRLKIGYIIFIISFIFISIKSNFNIVSANELSNNIDEQLNSLNLTELENFFNQIIGSVSNENFNDYINKLLKGEYSLNANTFVDYITTILLNNVMSFLPTLISILIISILFSLLQNSNVASNGESVAEITFFVIMMSVVLLLSTQFIGFYKNTENIIKNIAKLTEIMSPIIITLMIAIGGNVSAGVYKPIITFFIGGIINIFLYVVMPLIFLMTIFNIASNFSSTIKLNKFVDFSVGVIKWIMGLIIAIFSLFLTVQGITSAHFDGISIKAAKYAISSSIPIVGGFLKDGFDLVVAGSVLIKNAIGVSVVFILLFLIISPVIKMGIFSLLLKLLSAIIEPICDVRISNFCLSISKTISYLIAVLLATGFMLFFTVILMTITANAFI